MDQNISKLKEILKKDQYLRDTRDIKVIASYISNVKFFSSLKENSSVFKECCMYLTYEFFTKSEFVFKQGDYGDKFYILLKGEASVLVITDKVNLTTEEVLVYKDGSSFGELGLTDKKPRAASIYTKSDCHFAVLDKQNYNRILATLMKKKRNELVDFLQRQLIFQKLTRGSLLKLSYCFEEKQYKKEFVLYQEGQRIEYLYMIKEGQVKISKKLKINIFDSNSPMTRRTIHLKKFYHHKADISILGKGELLGVYDIDNDTYSSTGKCIADTTLLVITKEDFKKRVNNPDSKAFLDTGKILKDTMHENNIKSITKIAIDRIVTPYHKIIFEETIKSSSCHANQFGHKNSDRTPDRALAQSCRDDQVMSKDFSGTGHKTFDNRDQSFYSDDKNFLASQRVKTSASSYKDRTSQARPRSSRVETYSVRERKKISLNDKEISDSKTDLYNNSQEIRLNNYKKHRKNIIKLLNHIRPFGKNLEIKGTKEDEMINIHAKNRIKLFKASNPHNWSFKSIRVTPIKSMR
jgi:CRP-like cAMP-binding protein